jgi:hypothetical protein
MLALRRISLNVKDTAMNWDRLKENRKQFRRLVKVQRGRLTDD